MAAEKEAQATAVENSFVAEKTDSNRNFGIGKQCINLHIKIDW